MKERPILFSAPMVCAILSGTKTQTRRIMKPQPSLLDWHPVVGPYHPIMFDKNDEEYPGPEVFGASDEDEGHKCPYGQPGDRLWVRETWAPSTNPHATVFRADMMTMPNQRDLEVRTFFAQRCELPEAAFKWKPSLFMPRAASRITLEVTGVRVERLQDISEADAKAEGVGSSIAVPVARWPVYSPFRACVHCGQHRNQHVGQVMVCFGRTTFFSDATHRGGYAYLWEQINGSGSWEANPWVWAIDFKRILA